MRRVLSAVALAVAVTWIYADRLSAPFVFDDHVSILENPTILSLSWPTCLVDPRAGSPTAGRPLVNLSFALNYAFSRFEPFGYHVFNLAVHMACVGLVFLCLARLLSAERVPAPVRKHAQVIAGVSAALFAVHPIALEIVLYSSQRSEGMVAMFFLLAFHQFLRYAAGRRGAGTLLLAALAAIGGALTKATIVVLLPLVLLCDRAFFAGSFAQALRQRWPLYAALSVAYLPLVALEARAPRGNSVTFWDPTYLLAQGRFVAGYLRSVFWPKLALDYGTYHSEAIHGAWPYALAIGALISACAVLVFTHPRLGFVGAWVFALLAPTSTVFVIHTEIAADRRMYLPMVALIAASVAGWAVLFERLAQRGVGRNALRGLALAGIGPAFVTLATLTFVRTDAFASEVTFWEHALAEQPHNSRAAYNLAQTHQRAHDLDAAQRAYELALYLSPNNAQAHSNLGALFMQRQDTAAGMFHLRRALQLDGSALSHYNYSVALRQSGDLAAARGELERVLSLDPLYVEAHVDLGVLLMSMGELEPGLSHLARAVTLHPEASLLLRYAIALQQLGRRTEAKVQLERALGLNPKLQPARALLAQVEHELLQKTGAAPFARAGGAN